MSLLSRHRRRAGILFALLACGLAAHAADTPSETPEQALVRILDANRSALSIAADGLSGPGAKSLVERARHAQFVLVGEDHGFADVPQFVLALKQSLGKDTPENLVLEIGPYAAQRLTQAVRTDKLRELALEYPGAMPFFDWQDDGRLAAAWQRGNPRDVLWGLDQEFLFGARMSLQRLQELTKPGKGRDTVDSFLARDAAASKESLTKHEAGAALLLNLSDADIASLREAVQAAPGSEAAQLVDELDQSAQIYRSQNSDGYASNSQRSLLMKKHFMRYYRAAQRAGSAAPRALFRFGAYHMTRGITPTNLYDIGNFASEFAASNDSQSVHILVLAGGGASNKWMPFVADEAQKSVAYDAKKELAELGAVPFLQQSFAQGATVFDVDALRRTGKARRSGGADFEKIVFGYDFVVIVAEMKPARNY